jgi:hypothetical protein
VCGVGAGTQGLVHARLVLCHWVTFLALPETILRMKTEAGDLIFLDFKTY